MYGACCAAVSRPLHRLPELRYACSGLRRLVPAYDDGLQRFDGYVAVLHGIVVSGEAEVT